MWALSEKQEVGAQTGSVKAAAEHVLDSSRNSFLSLERPGPTSADSHPAAPAHSPLNMTAVKALNPKAEVARAQAALAVNISAARGLQDVLKSNLGPKGTMKM